MTSAKELAVKLFEDMQSGKLMKIGIDEINAAIRAEDPNLENVQFQIVQQNVTRAVVELSANWKPTKYRGAGDLDAGAPNHFDSSKRGFDPK